MAVAARIAEFEAMTTTDPLGAVGHSATSLADAGAVGAAGVATGAATGAAVVAVVAPEPPVAPLEKDQGQPPARDQGQPPARDQGQPPAKAPSTARAQKPEFYAMSETASCPPPAPPPVVPPPPVGPPVWACWAGPPSAASYSEVIDDNIQFGECAFGGPGCEGCNPAYQCAPEQVCGGDSNAQMLAGIVSSAAHKIRNVFEGANDNELLAVVGRLIRNTMGHLRTAPCKKHNGSPHGPPRRDTQWGPGLGPTPPPGPPPPHRLSWNADSTCDEDEFEFIAGGTSVSEAVHNQQYAMSEGGGASTNPKKRAPTVISMAAPPDKNGVVLTMGGEKLTIDSGGRLVNSSGQRCDQYGRLTKARGNKGGVNKKVAYEKGSRWHSSHWRDADEGSHWRDAEEGSRWHGSHWRYDDWHGADESDGNPWNKWTGTGSSSADAWMSNAPPAPSGPVPTSTKVTLTDCALGAGADLDQGDRDQGFDCTPDCAYAIAAKAQYVTGILAPPPPPPTEPTYEDMQDTVWASGGYTKEEWDEPI